MSEIANTANIPKGVPRIKESFVTFLALSMILIALKCAHMAKRKGNERKWSIQINRSMKRGYERIPLCPISANREMIMNKEKTTAISRKNMLPRSLLSRGNRSMSKNIDSISTTESTLTSKNCIHIPHLPTLQPHKQKKKHPPSLKRGRTT